jgi:hypothetical protein
VAAVALGCVGLAAACRPAVMEAACTGNLRHLIAGTVTEPALVEASGVAASARNADVWWAHNDAGHPAQVFAIGTAGQRLGAFTVANALPIDWEDIAVGPGPVADRSYLYIADTGGNAATREEVQVYRVPEPRLPTNATTLTGTAMLRLRYPDRPRDAESLVVDPETGELTIITKTGGGGTVAVYRAPGNLTAGSVTTLTKVGDLVLPTGSEHAVTGADLSAAGDTLAVRTYGSVLLWHREPNVPIATVLGQTPCRVPAPPERQGEAIGFTRDGRSYVTLGEGANPPLHQYSAP